MASITTPPDRGQRPATASTLGTRLRSLRVERAWTLEQLSRASGLARSTLSKIENGLLSPTYDALLKLADGLELDIAELFATPSAHMGSGRRSICRKGEGQPHPTSWCLHELLCSELAHKQMMPFVTTVSARPHDPPEDWSRHHGEEFVYVLGGEIELHTEYYQPERLQAGDSFYLDSRMGHRVISVGADDARVLWVSTQPGSLTQHGTTNSSANSSTSAGDTPTTPPYDMETPPHEHQ